jgi:hypothetical protein
MNVLPESVAQVATLHLTRSNSPGKNLRVEKPAASLCKTRAVVSAPRQNIVGAADFGSGSPENFFSAAGNKTAAAWVSQYVADAQAAIRRIRLAPGEP